MEILVTLKKFEQLKKISDYKVKGVILGTNLFSNRFLFDLDELKKLALECIIYNLDMYVMIDALIEEYDRHLLKEYIEFLQFLRPKGIYFSDLGVYRVLKELDFKGEMIYDPSTLITNSLDASFLLNNGIDRVVASREITLDEIAAIAKNTAHRLDMQIFGYLRQSTSKRHFLKNYFEHLGRSVDISNAEDVRIIEKSRDYKMPIYEGRYGTDIYTDYILYTYEETALLDKIIDHAIIDSLFIEDDLLFKVLRDYSLLNENNSKLLANNLKLNFEDKVFDKGYLYQKTNITKKEFYE